jgi:hypothetical protein
MGGRQVTKQMRVYIAGPMRGLPLFNFPAFDAAADRLRAAGFEPVNPAEMDRQIGFDPATDKPTPEFLRKAIARDLQAITECDAIALLPAWQSSTGAMIEFSLARMIGLQVLDATTLFPFSETVLDEAKRLVYGDRAMDYGHPLDECTRIAAFWSVILKTKVRPEHIPVCMVCMKISREMNRRKRDNAVDIAGYAECLNRIHDEQDRREREVDEDA